MLNSRHRRRVVDDILLKETRVYPNGSRIPVEEQYESARFRQDTEATGGGQNAETGEDPE